MIIPITVHVPESRVPEFYIQFGEFLTEDPSTDTLSPPLYLPSGRVPAWTQDDDASQRAAALTGEMSGPGIAVLRHLVNAAQEETAIFTAGELAEMTGHPHGKSGVAGILGGVGKAIRRVGLPMYATPRGNPWHYVWDWDGERYSMTPEVARLLKAAWPR